MKYLFINTTFKTGSTGKIVYNFYDYVQKKGDCCYVLYGEKNKERFQNTANINSIFERKATIFLSRLTGLTGFFSFLSTKKALTIIKKNKPDIVLLGNMHGYYINFPSLFRFLRKKKIPIIHFMWDEYPMTGTCTYPFECEKFKSTCGKCPHRKLYPSSWLFDCSKKIQKAKKRAFNGQDITFVGVPFTAQRARLSFILSNHTIVPLDEAVDQKNLYYPRQTDELRKQLKIPINATIILTVSVLSNKRKGGTYFLELAKRFENNPNYVFIYIGFNMDNIPCPKNVIKYGIIESQETMALFYSLADLFVCTSLAETQPNACLEALSCGTPICGFDLSGTPTCAEPPFGTFVQFPDISELENVVLKTTKKTDTDILKIREYAQRRFSSDLYNQRIIEISNSILERKK